MKYFIPFGLLILLGALRSEVLAQDNQPNREVLQQALSAGNFKEAFEGFRALVLSPRTDPDKVGHDLTFAVNCLSQLGRVDEVDDLLEKAVTTHPRNWELLASASNNYMNTQHNGYIVGGVFHRGYQRGGTGRYVQTVERDRSRVLQLLLQALHAPKPESRLNADLWQQVAGVLSRNWDASAAWQLQHLTDLSTLPDYAEGYYGRETAPAPAAADGTPVFFRTPKSWESAANDGERFRWALLEQVEAQPDAAESVKYQLADFWRSLYDVHTLASFGLREAAGENETGVYAVQTLGEDETIARLAGGIKRFKLPDDFNFIRIFQSLADTANSKSSAANAADAAAALASIFENRRQFPKAADYWRIAIKWHGPGPDNDRQKRLDQIVGAWGQFELLRTQQGGENRSSTAAVDYRFRNGRSVALEAYEIDIDKLLADTKAYLKANPQNLDWNKIQLQNVGYLLVEKKQLQYRGAKVASWSQELSPRENYFDTRVTIQTPLKKAGAYLVTATIAGGNQSNIIFWLADTALVEKPAKNGMMYFLADSETGKPVPNAHVDFFGYRTVNVDRPDLLRKFTGRYYDILTTEFAEKTNDNGLAVTSKQGQDYRWLITARTPDGRLAWLGFNNVWPGNYYDREYEQTKSFFITDRPVYRPEQKVKFKAWVAQAKYDVEGRSSFAGSSFPVEVHNPKGEKTYETTLTADEYGGIDGEWLLTKDSPLGVYTINIPGLASGTTFRVEEYKKPEYEVTVDAPKEPVMLGDKIKATLRAQYYFGAPVTEAKVKFKVLRSNHEASWYPLGIWDWLFGPGYWWFAYDYDWYPGWSEWGCRRPRPWWSRTGRSAPELVQENEVPVGKDGTVTIEIDTQIAKELYGDKDHRYEITAEVTDQSRRTIVGSGEVLAARKPFTVYAWVDRGHYRTGDTIRADFLAQTLDHKPVAGEGQLELRRVTYKDRSAKPVESVVEEWKLNTDEQGKAAVQIKAAAGGQYRLSYTVADKAGHRIEGGYLFNIAGEGFNSGSYRFDDLELIPDKREYSPDETVHLMVNTNRRGATVLLFVRPANSTYLEPEILSLKGKSITKEITVSKKDMPNFFVEAVTISGGKVSSEVREIVVPPEKKVLNVEVQPSATVYKPGAAANVALKLTDLGGKPFFGSAVLSVYDKAVEYISGGSNVPEIKAFFWKWRRQHQSRTTSNLEWSSRNIIESGKIPMRVIGALGYELIGSSGLATASLPKGNILPRSGATLLTAEGEAEFKGKVAMDAAGAPLAASVAKEELADLGGGGGLQETSAPAVQVRKEFADTAFWIGRLETNGDGVAEVNFTMPENLTEWKIKAWAMGRGTRVGEGSVSVVTAKNLLLRLQAPRFFVEKDEVVLSANIHNYLKTAKTVIARLELPGEELKSLEPAERSIEIAPGTDQRVDWRVAVVREGEATVRMLALADEESDAMEMRFPVYVHGMLKTDSASGYAAPDKDRAAFSITVPQERRINQTRLEVRYSPSLAAAMIDALPYLINYPYGCTEQTLNRFLPTLIAQRVLQDFKLNLKDIREKRTNLNAQEIGDDSERAKGWKRYAEEPVFDEERAAALAKAGFERLEAMQLSDGGWGWFSGGGEYSSPHTTATVVHGLQTAKRTGAAVNQAVIDRGISWLVNYQAEETQKLINAPATTTPWKSHADNLDALVYMVLIDADRGNAQMRDFLYRDRNELAVYGKAMFALALYQGREKEKLAMLMQNIGQFLVQDDENQTAYLKLNEPWWYWYGSEYEAQAYYLKLLSLVDPKSTVAPRLVKYLLNNRKHASYWNSTRDTALVIEAFADYLKASGEMAPDLTLEVLIDGRTLKEVKINKDNLFSFDNKVVLLGDALDSGTHKVEFRKKGRGPLYYNGYLTNFTLEDYITKAGLEIKVDRKYYKLEKSTDKDLAPGAHGQALEQRVEKYTRKPVANLEILKSGELAEVELEIESKNDYEYLVFEDMKPAGFEPVEVRSGYNNNDLGAYVEYRDERVVFFSRTLARGKHSVSYRVRAEIPGKFSALPTRASAMYAPELKANSDEIKLGVED